MNQSDDHQINRSRLAQRHLEKAKGMVKLSILSIGLLPIAALVIGAKSISPRADIPIEGCVYGCSSLFIGSFIPFGTALYAISLYKISEYLSWNPHTKTPFSWVNFIANTICIIFGATTGLTYLYFLFTIISGIVIAITIKPSAFINKQIFYSLAVIKPLVGVIIIFLSVYAFYKIYRLQFKYQE